MCDFYKRRLKVIRLLAAFSICSCALSANAAGFGTGFFVSSNGHVITNAHVIVGAHQVSVRTPDGAIDTAQVISVDRNNDLALLKIDRLSKGLHLKSTDGLDKGAKVFTIGYPNPSLQGLEAKYTEGVVSSFSGIAGAPNVMQISVPIQPGNSGGPLVDAKGSVVGVIVSKLNALAVAAKQDYIPENVNYAVKSDYALPLLLAIPSPERATPRPGLAVRDFEASVVLVAAFSKEDLVAQSNTTATASAQTQQPKAVVRRVTIVGPSTAENGCVVPIGFTVLPALGVNESATLKIGDMPAVKVRVQKGSLREFQYRIRMAASADITVDCPGCSGASFRIQVGAGCSEANQASQIGDIRIVVRDDTFRSMVGGAFPSGDFSIEGPESEIRVESTPATALNPFVMYKSDSALSGRYCLKVSTPFGSKENCS